MKKKKMIFAMGAFIALSLSQESYALGAVSRVCNFNEIPPILKKPALLFFRFLGMPEELWDLDTRPTEEQRNHWILESLTTDYGSLRYYLFAEGKVYNYRYKSNNDKSPMRNLLKSFSSPWAADSIDPRLITDSRLDIFKFNRNVLFSARAGHPAIVELYNDSNYLEPTIRKEDSFVVLGRHYYVIPGTTQFLFLSNTIAYDCNLDQLGLEDR